MENPNSHHKISYDTVFKKTDQFAIKSIILSDNKQFPDDFSLAEPFVFDGAIFGLCLKGYGKLHVNYDTFDILPNSILVIKAENICKICQESDDFLIETIFCSADYFLPMPPFKDFEVVDSMNKNPCLVTTKENMLDLLEYHSFIYKQYRESNNIYGDEMIGSILYALILKISNVYKEIKQKQKENVDQTLRHEEIVEKFFSLLASHYRDERNISFYADKLCLTNKYLSTIIKNYTGYPIIHWIHETLLAEVKKQLKTSDLTILEISENLNFSNPSFFGRFFKDYTGMTPVEYRNN